MDSLDLVEFVMILEEGLGIAIPDAVAERLTNLEAAAIDPEFRIGTAVVQMALRLIRAGAADGIDPAGR